MRRPIAIAFFASFFAAFAAFPAEDPASPAEKAPFAVSGDIALRALMSLADGHLQETADVLRLVAANDRVRSGEWERIRGPLAAAAKAVVPAVLWYARRDGEYWTAPLGRAPANLADRPYFPKLMAGRDVIGDLVVSRSSNRNTAIVAVPVRDARDKVIGALGASVYLDQLGQRVRAELGGLAPGLVFFAIDARPLGAIHSDPSLIFTDPMTLGDDEMRGAFRQILGGTEGTVTYAFRGMRRTVIYRKSDVSGWWYALGITQDH